MKIRRAEHADIEAMSVLLQELFRIEADFEGDPERQRQGLQRLLDGCGKHRTALVAVGDGRVIGMATVQLVISTAEGAPSAWVEDVVVDDAWSGQGIGSRLMAEAAAWAAKAGATRLQLLADRDNQPALSFYRRQGWRQTRLICLRKESEF